MKLEIVLLPDEADLVLRALDKAREPQSPETHSETPSDSMEAASAEAGPGKWPSRADGMVSMAHTFLANPKGHGGAGTGFQVMVHVGQDPLAADGVLAATLEDGTHLSTEALRRVTCDSGMVAVSETGQGMTVGRRTRSIPSAMRRALIFRDHGCRFPGCTHNQFLHGHHIQHWLHGGETSVDNLVMLCSHHHHLVGLVQLVFAGTTLSIHPPQPPPDGPPSCLVRSCLPANTTEFTPGQLDQYRWSLSHHLWDEYCANRIVTKRRGERDTGDPTQEVLATLADP